MKQAYEIAAMPKDYVALCGLFLQRPIHDAAGYEDTVEIADAFAGFEDQMTADQNDYFDLLCDLIGKWEKDTVPPPKLRAIALLKHLAEERGISGAALSRILGKSPSLGLMILRGERKITADHAVSLGKYFSIRPDVFLS